MKCSLCGHDKPHKHGKTSKGAQRYFCPKCRQTFTETFDTLYYRRQVSKEDVRIVRSSANRAMASPTKQIQQNYSRTKSRACRSSLDLE